MSDFFGSTLVTPARAYREAYSLSHGAELVCKFKQGSSCAELLSLVSKG